MASSTPRARSPSPTMEERRNTFDTYKKKVEPGKVVADWPNKWSDSQWPIEHQKCSVCFCIPFGEVRLCNGSHILCRYCLNMASDRNCPICRTLVPSTGSSRNYVLEEFIKNGTFECPRGCKETHSGREMFLHIEDDCKNREISCPLCCLKKGDGVFYGVKVLELLDHLNTHGDTDFLKENNVHKFKKTFCLSQTEDFPGLQHLSPNIFKFDGQLFTINFRAQRDGYLFDMMIIWVQIMAGREEARKYRSAIKLKSTNGNQISWDVPVSSVDGKRPWIGNMASLTFYQLREFGSEFSFNPFDQAVFKFEPEVVMIKVSDPEPIEQEVLEMTPIVKLMNQ